MLLLKMWQKILSVVLVVVIATTAILLLTQEEKECCLCSSFRYHAPCLIDLETGDLIELDLYFPDDELVAELENPQPEIDTFSFVKLGNVSGTKLTGNKTIELHIPNDKTPFPSLCKECKEQLPFGYTNRYVFADLYGMEEKFLIPIAESTTISFRCYDLSMEEDIEKGGISVVIQGTLQKTD